MYIVSNKENEVLLETDNIRCAQTLAELYSNTHNYSKIINTASHEVVFEYFS